MCKRVMGGIAGALAIACGLAMPTECVLAQSQAEYRARVEALAPIWRRESAEYRHRDSLQIQALPKDTLHVGVFTILASSSLQQNLARSAGTVADVTLRARFGESADAVRAHRFALTWPPENRVDSTVVDVAEIDSTGRLTQWTGMAATTSAVSGSLTQRGSQILTTRLGQGFARWVNGSIPTDTATRSDWIDVRIDLVTSSFQMSQECYAGNIASCEKALGVVDETDPAREWFSATERRDIVHHDSQLRRGQEEAFDKCVIRKIDAECTMLAGQIPIGEIQPPLGSASRQSLVRLAMQIGGAQAYARMRQAPDTRGGQLAAASGISTDSLVRAWQAYVITTEPEQTTMTPGLALISLVWVSTCGALALGSSRWR